jgi:hypothetical protein
MSETWWVPQHAGEQEYKRIIEVTANKREICRNQNVCTTKPLKNQNDYKQHFNREASKKHYHMW